MLKKPDYVEFAGYTGSMGFLCFFCEELLIDESLVAQPPSCFWVVWRN
jgi:hypothetical protein